MSLTDMVEELLSDYWLNTLGKPSSRSVIKPCIYITYSAIKFLEGTLVKPLTGESVPEEAGRPKAGGMVELGSFVGRLH